jgi:hypothetical protein
MLEENKLLKLINTIVPPTSLKVIDLSGGEHNCSAALSARVQSRGIAALLEIMDTSISDAVTPLLSSGGDAPADQIEKMFKVIHRIASDEAVLVKLSKVVDVTYPSVIRSAAANLKEKGIGVPDSASACDLFEVDQLIALLSPFVLRLLKGLMDQKAKFLPQKA